MDLGLNAKIALVTGAANGIGRAVAESLASEGATVYLADVDERAVESVADALATGGRTAHPLGLDVGDAEAVQQAVTTILAREGRLDVAVNSAGILRTSSLRESTARDWEALSRVNVGGVYACCKAAGDAMAAQGYGKIVNLASISAFKGGGSIGNALYGASKAAVVALTKGFAREYGPLGVNVNALAPAVTETPMIRGPLDEPATRERLVRAIPLGRIAQPREIAALAVFLASDQAAYLNGSVIVIDGGLLTV
jgi:NAD(P)-dependent dehydrogenase (short-subunit alcohol dehydrogenase family)